MTWWITRAARTLSEEVPAAPRDVRGFYVDLENLKAVHPLIVSVRTVSRVETTTGYDQTYRVRDRIPLGRLTLPISYRARLHVPVHGDVTTEARQFPRVRLTATVTFEPVAAGTRLTENLTMCAPRPLAAMTIREAVQAHREMLAGVRRHFQESS
ncbi:SRPBCC family protein [Mycobacterium sp.]|uniref:SRPBCC family protein n=1 Tax=Mycobacterium sp. TaxID=1785 RepID=UPI0031DFDC9A